MFSLYPTKSHHTKLEQFGSGGVAPRWDCSTQRAVSLLVEHYLGVHSLLQTAGLVGKAQAYVAGTSASASATTLHGPTFGCVKPQ
jgi:hypothetical protein